MDNGPLAVVLDTNVVLDWLLFEDPAVQPLAAALAAQRVRWIATTPMLDELAAVLRRPVFERWANRLEHALTYAQGHAALEAQPVMPLARMLHCTDPDDQKFIDLALAAPARWLVTRDKALLKLARPALRRGVLVCRPAGWISP